MNAMGLRNGKRRPFHMGWALGALALFLVFFALGTWQVQRRVWKLDLIERVNERISATAVDAPSSPGWALVNAANDEYRHVQVTGRFMVGRDVRVQAVTTVGSGFWLLSPLERVDGSVVLVNRGFVSPQWIPVASTAHVAGTTTSAYAGNTVTISGLLRLTEPGGGFLRTNDPATGRWFSRDVLAIAKTQGLLQVAPYFVDAGPAPAGAPIDPTEPVGGLTVIAFHNSHLVYALTWYVLALMVAGAAIGLALHNAKHDDHPSSADPAN